MITNLPSNLSPQPSQSSIASSSTNDTGSGRVRASNGETISINVSFGTNTHPTSPETNVSDILASHPPSTESVCQTDAFTSRTFNKLDETKQKKLIALETVMEQQSTHASDLTHGESFIKTRPRKILGGAYELLPTFHAYQLVESEEAQEVFEQFSRPQTLPKWFPVSLQANETIDNHQKNITSKSTFNITLDPESLISKTGFLKNDTIKIVSEVKEDAECKTASYLQDEEYSLGTKVASKYLRKVEASLTIEPYDNETTLVHFKLFFDPRGKAALDMINVMDAPKFSKTQNEVQEIFYDILGRDAATIKEAIYSTRSSRKECRNN